VSERPPSAALRTLRGIVLLACFRSDGLAAFPATAQAFLNSLAPLIAFPLVFGLVAMASSHAGTALGDLLATVVALLTPPVVSHILARAWGREERWLRYAVAFNWCQWCLPLAVAPVLVTLGLVAALAPGAGAAGVLVLLEMVGMMFTLRWFLTRQGVAITPARISLFVLLVNAGVGLLMAAPLAPPQLAVLAVLPVAAYVLSLHWFLARHGLGLSVWRAALCVIAINVATGLLVMGPRLLMGQPGTTL
jgi:hypothetical protein